jgi:hypothetical protein
MNSKSVKLLLFMLLSIAFLIPGLQAKDTDKEKEKKQLNKTLGTPVRTFLNINNISTQIYNDGNSDIKPDGNSGLIYPKGSGKGAVFESGLVWGAKVPGDPQPRVGGSTYRQGLQPGKIISPGVAEDPDLDKNRIYRVRRDVYPGGPDVDLALAAVDEGISATAIRTQYEKDWNEWPVADGAPYEDVDGNGSYDPTKDIPGVPGADQTIWFVANDLDAQKTTFLYGAQPLGIEMQATMWAYAQAGALGNMFFRKYKIINKSNTEFDSTYVSMWSDVDLGNSTDDFAGCDTTLSLGYCYNATNEDGTYDPLPPPAVGFDFFQGPIVDGEPTDTAIFNGQYVFGKKNLPMTSFFYYARGDASVVDPTLGALQGSSQFYNFMQGKIGLTGQFFVNPITNQQTTYVLTGNPQTGEGWIDGQILPAGDRRIGLASGPFQMAPGDTQEVVVAEIIAGATPGISNLDAIGLLKVYDIKAQEAYDAFFILPAPPPKPNVSVAALDKEIVLNWGTNLNDVVATENYDFKGFKFEGYNVYQLPSVGASFDQAKRLATYDLPTDPSTILGPVVDPSSGQTITIPQQFGSNGGIKRYIKISKDAFTNRPLVNGNRYYFAVTAYAYSTDSLAVPNNLENPLTILTVIPQEPNPGIRYSSQFADTVKNVVHDGNSNGSVVPIVIDPTKLTGDQYKVNFSVVNGETVWSVTNVTKNVLLLSEQVNQSGDDVYYVVDGLLIKVLGPPLLGTDWSATGERWLSGSDANGGELMFGAAFVGPNFVGSSVAPGDLKDVRVEMYKVDSYVDANGNGAYDVGEIYTVGADKGQNANMYITWGAGNWEKVGMIPFKVFDISSNPPVQLDVVVRDRDGNGQWDPDDGNISFNYVWVLNTPYDATGNRWNPNAGGKDFMTDVLDGAEPILWTFWWVPRGTREQFANDFTMEFIAPKVNTPNDVFTFTAPTVQSSLALAKEDVGKVNVYPNPYYGVNSEELNKYNRFVTFTHLPAKATIRIFNLAGILVQRIDKEDNTQFTRWDLANQNGLPIASGLYIAHIEMPELGVTKILKIAIIQEQQILDRF